MASEDWFVVSAVNTTEGSLPVVAAAHEIIGQTLVNLIASLHNVFGEEVWAWEASDVETIGEAYTAFYKSPQTIVDKATANDQSVPGS